MTGIPFNLGQYLAAGISAPTYGNNGMWVPKWQVTSGNLPEYPVGLSPALLNELYINVKDLTLTGGSYGTGSIPNSPRSLPSFPTTNNVQHKVAGVFPFNSTFGSTSFSGMSGVSQVSLLGGYSYWNPVDGLFYPHFIYQYNDGTNFASTAATGAPVGTVVFLGKNISINQQVGAPGSNSVVITINSRF